MTQQCGECVHHFQATGRTRVVDTAVGLLVVLLAMVWWMYGWLLCDQLLCVAVILVFCVRP